MISEINRVLNGFEDLVTGPIENYWFFFSKPVLLRLLALLFKVACYYFVIYMLLILELIHNFFFCPVCKLLLISRFISVSILIINRVTGLHPAFTIKIHEAIDSFIEELKNMLYTTRQRYIASFWCFLIDNSIKRHDTNIKIIITGNMDYDDLLSGGLNYSHAQNAMVISNHRSIFDYILLQSIFFDLDKICASSSNQTPLGLLTWGLFLDIPNLRFLKQIFSSNENFEVDINATDKQKYFYKPILLFPEVNVMTKKVKIMQDKLNLQNGNKVFQESLYPRYNAFLELCHYYQCNKNKFNITNKLEDNSLCNQQYFFNVTLSYHKPELVSQVNHMHNNASHSNTENHNRWFSLQRYKYMANFRSVVPKTTSTQEASYSGCKYQVIQIAPSLLECFLSIQSNNDQPLIIKVHLEKLPLNSLLEMTDKQLELFLEYKFEEKDYIINNFEENLTIKEYKKRYRKTNY